MKLLSRLIGILGLSLTVVVASAQRSGRHEAGAASIEFLDVGQGDSILIRSPEGKTALIDAGPSNRAASLIKARGIRSIDLAVVTHHHADHYGGMAEVVRDFHPRYFLASSSPHTTPTYLRLLKAVEASGARAIAPTAKPRRIELGSLVLTVFPRAPVDVDDENNNSIGIRVEHGGVSVLLTGDSEERERRWWLKSHPELIRDATILKLAHHGSRNGTDARWLATVRPELAVASLGKGNDYGHPHPETLSLLDRARIPLLRTDKVGTVTIRSDGRGWEEVRPEVADRATPRVPSRRR